MKAIICFFYVASNSENKEHAAHAYGFAGRAAEALFKLSEEQDWAERWYTSELKSAELSENKKHSIHAYSFAGEAAGKRFMLTKKRKECLNNKIKWAENWYNAKFRSAELAENFDKVHSAHAYSFAGNAAYLLYTQFNLEEYKSKFISHYEIFINYVMQNKIESLHGLVEKLKIRIKECSL